MNIPYSEPTAFLKERYNDVNCTGFSEGLRKGIDLNGVVTSQR